MKKTILMTSLALIIACTGCGTGGSKGGNTPNIPKNTADNSITVLTDSPPVFTVSELRYPEETGMIRGIFYVPSTDKITLIGENSAAITDGKFGSYKVVSLPVDGSGYDVFGDRIAIADDENVTVCNFDGQVMETVALPQKDEYGSWNVRLTDGEIYACDGKNCYRLDMSGNALGEIEDVSYVVRSDDGGMLGVRHGKGQTELIDLESGDILAKISESLNGMITDGCGGYMAFITGKRVYGVRADRTAVPLLDSAESGAVNAAMITPVSDGRFAALEGGRLVLMAEDPEGAQDIREINLAIAGRYDIVAAQTADFNRRSTKYRVKITDYSANTEYSAAGLDEAVKALEMDLIAGNIPDMVWIEPNEAELIAAKGAFADLYEFMDNDRTYSRDAFLPNYLKARETDGHLYTIEPCFSIKALGAKAEHVPNTHWDMEEFKAIYRGLPDGMELFETANHKSVVLDRLSDDLTAFVDLSRHSCSFDSAEFIELLRFADEFPSMDEYVFENCSCRNDTALLEQLLILDPRDMNAVCKAKFCGDAVFPDYPTGGGGRFCLENQYAILENSPNKEGAWEYLRSCLGDGRVGDRQGFPVVEASFKLAMEAAMEPFDNGYGGEYYHDWALSADIPVEPMTAEEMAGFEAFIRTIDRASSPWSMTTIDNIVDEEAAYFFAGERSAEDCAKIIQNRVETFLSEQE